MAKFRSWNKDLKEFIYFKDGYYYTHRDCSEEEKINNCLNFDLFIKEFWQKKERSTGLFDINGKEAFENDELSDGKGVGVVTYFKNIGQFLVVEENGNAYYLNEGDITRQCKLQYSEIIGNTHEGVN